MIYIIFILIAVINCGYFNDTYSCLVLFITALIAEILAFRAKIIITGLLSKSFILLFLFGLFYILQIGSSYALLYWLLPCAVFFAGWCLVDTFETIRVKRLDVSLSTFILAISCGCLIHIILNLITNFTSERWAIIDYFSGTVRSATGAGSVVTLVVCLCPFIVILKKNYQKVAIAGICLVALMYTLLLGSRTSLVVLVVTFFAVVAFHFHNERRNDWILRLILIVIVISALILIAFKFDFLGVRTYYENSNLYDRLYDSATYASDDERLSRWWEGLKSVFLSPFGGNKDTVRYYHNFWLDINRVSGVIPMILMIIFYIRTFRHVLEVSKRRDVDSNCVYLMLCVYTGTFINFFFEPALEGLTDLYLRFCFINGITEGFYSYLINREDEGDFYENS